MKKLLTKAAAFLTACVFCLLMPLTAHADGVSKMKSLINNYSRGCAVVVYSLEDGELYSYHKTTSFFGASLIKLPYAYFACTQIDAGVHSLDDTMTYTSSWYHGGSGIIRKGSYGKKYTVRQLLDYAMRYSDNVAYDMLVYLFGTSGFNSLMQEWGYSVKLGTPSPRWPNLTADFMRTSMQKMYERRNDGEAWQTTWTGLCKSTATYVRGALPGTTAVKYGNVSYVWHETCFVDGDYPYVLVIMTSISGSPNTTFIKNTAKAAGQIVEDYRNQKAASQPEPTEPPTEAETLPPETAPPLTEAEPTEETLPPETAPPFTEAEPTEETLPPETAPPLTETEPAETDALPTETQPTEEEPLPPKGDVNSDTDINAMDAEAILLEAASVNAGIESTLNEEQRNHADLDGDSKITANDAALVLQYAACRGTGLATNIRQFLAMVGILI